MNTNDDLMCRACRGKGIYAGLDITCRSCRGSGLEPVQEKRYRIEKRDEPKTLYWDERGDTWDEWPEMATIYSEAERKEALNRVLRGEESNFPQGGVWCVLDAESRSGGSMNNESPTLQPRGVETPIAECGYGKAWIGACKSPPVEGSVRCLDHRNAVCVSCNAPATHECDETGMFVCGFDLCDECEHAIFPNGTNGGVGFAQDALPEGMKRHCKKTEQLYQPWYAREDVTAPVEGTK